MIKKITKPFFVTNFYPITSALMLALTMPNHVHQVIQIKLLYNFNSTSNKLSLAQYPPVPAPLMVSQLLSRKIPQSQLQLIKKDNFQ